MWETDEMKGDKKEIDDVKDQDLWEIVKQTMVTTMCEEFYEMKGNEEIYVKKGNKKQIDGVKGQALGERSTRTLESKC